MFALVSRLKKVKLALKEHNREGFSDIQETYIKAYQAMMDSQEAMHLHPSNQSLADQELNVIHVYRTNHHAYLIFFEAKI